MTRLLALVALASLGSRPLAAQSVLERTPNLAGTWVGVPNTLHFNFLHRFGSTTLDQLATLNAESAEGEMSDEEMQRMRRYDTNRYGSISALDAPVVINRLDELSNIDALHASQTLSPVQTAIGDGWDDDEEEVVSVLV